VVAILAAEAAALPQDAPEWGRGAVATGPDEIGMAETGAAEAGTVIIGTADGGMATDGVIHGPTLSSLVILAFPGLGAGVGAAAGGTLTDITATDMGIQVTATGMDIQVTGTATAITGTGTAMDMETATKANTALPPSREWRSSSADSPVPGIIADQSTGS
jgi:hypothetical protein